MIAKVFYVSAERATRDQRLDAMDGKLLPRECFDLVAVVNVPDCFRHKDIADKRLGVCEAIFTQHQAVDGPVFDAAGNPVRSMSVGDVVVLKGEPGFFFCDRVGFTPMEGRFDG